ncbi:cucumopine synthase-related protein [[Kitasatospora] papulosa]|uniref:cucumopine synthase-related protein n=1 Tax=[Kitasatospora] papulosa TaxID=1464011 RepID=UPI00367AC95B
MKRVDIEWPALGTRVTATLAEDLNPELAQVWWSMLPYRSVQSHAVVADGHFYHLAPGVEPVHTRHRTPEDRSTAPLGSVYLSRLQHLLITYAPLLEPTVCARVARIDEEDLPTLRDTAEQCWDAIYRTKRIVEARVSRHRESSAPWRLPRQPEVTDPTAQALLDDLYAQTERIWLTPPDNLLDLHRGRVPLGSRGQYFSTLVYVNGELRLLGSTTLTPLVAATFDSRTTLDSLRAVLPPLTTMQADFLGHCGFHDLRELLNRAHRALPALRTKDEYRSLVASLALYVNCLRRWALHYFPWHHGESHPFASPASDRPGGLTPWT